jgi:hypothetical protein
MFWLNKTVFCLVLNAEIFISSLVNVQDHTLFAQDVSATISADGWNTAELRRLWTTKQSSKSTFSQNVMSCFILDCGRVMVV